MKINNCRGVAPATVAHPIASSGMALAPPGGRHSAVVAADLQFGQPVFQFIRPADAAVLPEQLPASQAIPRIASHAA